MTASLANGAVLAVLQEDVACRNGGSEVTSIVKVKSRFTLQRERVQPMIIARSVNAA